MINFEIVKSRRYGVLENNLFDVIEDDKYNMFEGNLYQCQVYVSDRRRGFDTITSTADAKRYEKPPRKKICPHCGKEFF